MGVNSISWSPAAFTGSLISSNPGPGQQRRFATGGSDNLIKIWDYRYVFEIRNHKWQASVLTVYPQRRVQDLQPHPDPGGPLRLGP